MKKIKNSFLAIVFTFFIGMMNVNAGSLTASTSYSTVYIGNTVTVNVSASGIAGKFSITSSNGAVLSGGTSSVWLDDQSSSFTFNAASAGTATVTVRPIDAADYSTGSAYTQSRTVTIRVIARPIVVLSTNNNLDGLAIDGYTISPEFNTDTLDYTLKVDSSIEKINVTARAADGSATVNGVGEKVLTDGDNKIEVVCTAQNGSSKTYTITVTVEDLNPIKTTIDGKEYSVVKKVSLLTMPATYTATSIKINDIDVPAFKSDITGYVLVGLKDSTGAVSLYIFDSTKSTYKLYKELKIGSTTLYQLDFDKKDIPVGYKESTIKINNEDIKVYKLNENSNYSLIYAMNISTGKVNIYKYDLVESTVQIYNNEELLSLNKTNDQYFKIIIGLTALSGILFISLIITLIVKRKNKKSEKEQIVDEVIEEITESKENKISNLLFDEEETRTEKNLELTDEKELKKLAKQTRKEELKKAKEDKRLQKQQEKEAKKNKDKVKVTKIKFDDDGSL